MFDKIVYEPKQRIHDLGDFVIIELSDEKIPRKYIDSFKSNLETAFSEITRTVILLIGDNVIAVRGDKSKKEITA